MPLHTPFSQALVDLTAKRYGELLNEHVGFNNPYTLAVEGPLSLQITLREDFSADKKEDYQAFTQEVAIVCHGVALVKSIDWNLYLPYAWSVESQQWQESMIALRKSLTSTVEDAAGRLGTSINQHLDRLNSARVLVLDGPQPGHNRSVCW